MDGIIEIVNDRILEKNPHASLYPFHMLHFIIQRDVMRGSIQ